ncbi:MAG: hypothetical protein WBE58_13830 [Verrucomicrobiales bacterium]
MPDTPDSRSWLTLARRLCLQYNTGWWLDRLNPLLVTLAILSATAIVLLRTFAMPLTSLWFLVPVGVLTLTALAGSYWWARRRFMRPAQALVRIEDRLGLCNALTCAAAGVGEWPQAKSPAGTDTPAGFRWRWGMTLLPVAASVAVVLLALLIPVTPVEATRPKPSQPSGWDQLEDYVETLKEQNIIEEKALEEVQEKIEELKSQPESEWFSHSSLEATDSLRQSLSREIQNLGNEMATAERGLSTLENYSGQLSQEEREKVLNDYQQAVQGLNSGALPMNSAMRQALSQIDPSQLGSMELSSLSQEQLDQLKKALKEGSAACQKCAGSGEGLPTLEKGTGPGKSGNGQGQGQGQGEGPGNGGTSRGPGTAPLTFGDENKLGTKNLESLQNPDLSHVAPGELISVGETKFDLDKTPRGPQQAGAVTGVGQGGDAVWRESLVPAEREVLKKFFKKPATAK